VISRCFSVFHGVAVLDGMDPFGSDFPSDIERAGAQRSQKIRMEHWANGIFHFFNSG
jgi:hypothetical protein